MAEQDDKSLQSQIDDLAGIDSESIRPSQVEIHFASPPERKVPDTWFSRIIAIIAAIGGLAALAKALGLADLLQKWVK
jgi:hypothetical protein